MKKLLITLLKVPFKLLWIFIQYALVISLSVPTYAYLGKPFLASFVYHPEIDEKKCLLEKNSFLEAWAGTYGSWKLKKSVEHFYGLGSYRPYELNEGDLIGSAEVADCGRETKEAIVKFLQYMENIDWKKFFEKFEKQENQAYEQAVAACCQESFWWTQCRHGLPKNQNSRLNHFSPEDEKQVLKKGEMIAYEYIEKIGEDLKQCPDVQTKFVWQMKQTVHNWFPAPRE